MRALLTAQNVWDRVERGAPEACWPFKGKLTSNGYGQIWFDGRLRSAHRTAYELVKGPIPEGLFLDHLCRNRRCCNPEHLEPVTTLENSRRAPRWKGNLDCCPQNHPYAGDNLYVRPSDGARICRTCRAWYARRAKQRRRAALRAQGLTSRGTPPKRGRPVSAAA